MADITHLFPGGFTPPEPQRTDPPEVQLRDAIERAGINPPREVILDGKIHRFDGDKRGDKANWYIGFPDGVPAGRFGSWKAGLDSSWRANVGRSLTQVEEMAHARRMAEAQALRKAEQAKTREAVEASVEAIWSGCAVASPDHPYLQKKGVGAHGARVTGDGRLVLPLYDGDGYLRSLQYIDNGGGKLFQAGAQARDCFWMVGTLDDPGAVYVAEGFATAASIHEATHRPCFIAFSAHNMPSVAMAVREMIGAARELVVVGDNDESGVGQKYAQEAATKASARLVIPTEQGDVNDYVAAGLDLGALLSPPKTGWVKRIADFASAPAPISWLVKRWLQNQALIMVHGPSGGGKAQPLDELVLTPDGWREMGQIKAGDYVVGSAGFPVLVTGVYPQGMKPEWEVEFSNGARVRCCDEHLWDVRKSDDGRRQILTTAEIAKRPHRTLWKVPLCRPVNYRSNGNPLPLDPYLLGALIGDGGITDYVGFSSVDEEIIEEIRKALPVGHEIRKKNGDCAYQIVVPRGQPNHVWTALRLLDLAGKKSDLKFIPEEYMTSSPMDRLSMLQGLMDTDGYVSAGNGTTADFSNSSRVLVEQVSALVASLGGIGNPIRTKETSGLPCHTVTFRMGKGVNPFRLSRKAKRCAFGGQNLSIRVLDAKPTGRSVEMQCISVASDDKLYVTNGYILTHNTFLVLDWCMHVAAGKPDWQGTKVRQGPVVYLAGEGHHGLKGRAAAWMTHHGVVPLDMWVSESGCDLNQPAGYCKVVDELTAQGVAPRLIVVDTLHRFLSGDENSAQDAKTMLDACNGLMAHFNCSVLLVHHTGVSEEAQHRARGSSAWRGALDIEISVVPGKDDLPIQIIQRKSKDAEIADPVYVQLKQVEVPGWVDEDGEPVTSAVIVSSEVEPPKVFNEKLTRNMTDMRNAWLESGCEQQDGFPYVSRAFLKVWLGQKHNDWNGRKIENNLSPAKGYAAMWMGSMLAAGITQMWPNGDDPQGWTVVDPALASEMFILANWSKND
jgi:phage/plasmid primase-like uncharacterized protein